jgi:bifunctional non-homologous end joining protein LigD
VASRRPKPITIDPSNVIGAIEAPATRWIEPQLATLVPAAPDGAGWAHEIKYDGYRMQAHIRAGATIFTSRNGLDWSTKFPELGALLGQMPVDEAIIDGEVCHVLPTGVTSFGALQDDLSRKHTDGLVFFAFDLVYLNGYRLDGALLRVRKQFLQFILEGWPDHRVRYSDHHIGQGPEFFAKAAAIPGIEGIVSKRLDAPYRPGRGTTWLKIKVLGREELIVVGFTDPEKSRVGVGGLLLGYYTKATGTLTFAGKVGTGFSDKLLAQLRGRLDTIERSEPNVILPKGVSQRGVHWVRPEIVVETSFTEWTRDGILRHPSFLGERLDKPAKDVVLDRALSPNAKVTHWAKARRRS